ncbi:hypothetical protein CSC71_05730 [Pseudoxanthomonas sangjuensis]|nr:hypothetical protein CSC71_05730 [Pseudoxanthomonas sangjuensis]
MQDMAVPKYRAREGQGEGVPVEWLDELLDELVDFTGRADASDFEAEVLHFSLLMIQRLERRREQNRKSAQAAFGRLSQHFIGIEDEDIARDIEILGACLRPINRMWREG